MPKNLDLTEKLEKYILNHSENLHQVQKNIIKHNESLGDVKKMQISISQAHFLHLFIKITKIKKILEIGTFTGFSSISMALALPKKSKLVTIDKNEKTSSVAKSFFEKANVISLIKQMNMSAIKALKILKEEKEIFDLIFIDADKENYKKYYNDAFDLTKKGGFIIIDNVLWHGEVADSSNNDKLTNIIKD